MQDQVGGFASTFEDMLAKQAAQKRQDLMDQLAIKREERLMQAELDTANERRRAHLETEQWHRDQRDEAKQKIREEGEKDYLKRKSGMVRGDIPDAEMLADAAKYGDGQSFPKPPEVVPGVAAGVPQTTPPVGQRPMLRVGNAPEMPPPGVQGPPIPAQQGFASSTVPAVRPFIGTPAERKAEAYINALPEGSRERKLAEWERDFPGRNPPAALTADETEAVYRQHPTTGQIEKVGEVPKGSHFMTEPPPKDTSAREAAQDMRKLTQANLVHQQGVTELDKWTAPYENQMKALRDLGTTLDEKNVAADSVVADLVYKSLVTGPGSGARMNNALIERILGGRTHWESFKVALSKWSTDSKAAMGIAPDQRKQLYALARGIRQNASSELKKAIKTRGQMDEAMIDGDVPGIIRLRTKLQEELFLSEDEQSETTTTQSDADLAKRADNLIRKAREKK